MKRRTFHQLLAAAAVAGPATKSALAANGFSAKVPRPSKEFAFEGVDGKQYLLSNFRGKGTLLFFLLTTCAHCQAAARLIQKIYVEKAAEGFQPLGVAINDMAKMLIPEFQKNYGTSFPIGYSPRTPVNNFLEHPEMLQMYMPVLVFVDRKGTIRAQHMGTDDFFATNQEANIRAMVDTILKGTVARTSVPAKAKSAAKPKA